MFYPTDDLDSPNCGGGYEEIKETHMSEPPTENQQAEEIGGVPIKIRGAPTEKSNDDSRKDNEDTIVKEIKITKPKVQFARESYMLRESKPTRTVLANDNSGHSYNLSIKNAIKTHGDIVHGMFESHRKINFPSYVKKYSHGNRDKIRNQELVLYEGKSYTRWSHS